MKQISQKLTVVGWWNVIYVFTLYYFSGVVFMMTV